MINLMFIFYRRFSHGGAWQYTRVLLFLFILLMYSASGYMYFELPENPDLKWGDAFWWSIVTMTTVGYGDFFPASTAGRLVVGLPTMLLGVSMLGYILSLIATAMIETKIKEAQGMKDLDLKGHIVVCGFGKVSRMLKFVHEIHQDSSTSNAPIVIIDEEIHELPAELLKEREVRFVKGDPCRQATLERANVSESRAVIIQAQLADSTHSDNNNLRVALTLNEIASDVYSIVECLDPDNEIFFRRANCNSIVCLSSLTEQMLVQELQDPGVGAIVSELTSNRHGKQFYIVDIEVGWKTYEEVSKGYKVNGGTLLLGIQRDSDNILLPDSDFTLSKGDKAILIATGRPRVER